MGDIDLTRALIGVGVIAFTWMAVSWSSLALTVIGALLLVEAFNKDLLSNNKKGNKAAAQQKAKKR